jgi:hypothetical protein
MRLGTVECLFEKGKFREVISAVDAMDLDEVSSGDLAGIGRIRALCCQYLGIYDYPSPKLKLSSYAAAELSDLPGGNTGGTTNKGF